MAVSPMAATALQKSGIGNLAVAPPRDRLLQSAFLDGGARLPAADSLVADSAPAAAAAAVPRAVRLVIRAIAYLPLFMTNANSVSPAPTMTYWRPSIS